MSIANPQPPKLNYAKGRMKSKTKNQAQSQQKIVFQGESSTDIFAHLNQDNLNYIKKELKNKKSTHNHQRAKSSNVIELNQRKIQQIKIPGADKSNQQQKMYQKYKNSNEVIQRDSREQQTLRQTEVDESVSSVQNQANSPLIKSKSKKQRNYYNNYNGLQPPPEMFKQKKQSLQSTESQHLKTTSLEIHKIEKRSTLGSKNNFLDYQIKSQNSNHQFANSMVSVQNQLSEDFSMTNRASQFIDHLQNYIQELNLTPQKQRKNNKSKSVLEKNQSLEYNGSKPSEIKNFKKMKQQIHRNRQEQYFDEDGLESYRSQKDQLYKPTSMNKALKINQEKLDSNYDQDRSVSLGNNKQQQEYTKNKNKKFTLSLLGNHAKNITPCDDSPLLTEQFNNLFILKQQLQKERYYCTKLALQLEKYKKNQQTYHKQIQILNQTILLLKDQIQNLKQRYQQQMTKTESVIKYIHLNTKYISQNRDKFDSSQKKIFKQNFDQNQEQNHFESQQRKAGNKLFFRRKSEPSSQFQDIMKFTSTEPIYNQLNPRFFNLLAKDFEKGQQIYKAQNNRRDPLIQKNNAQDFLQKDLPYNKKHMRKQNQKHQLKSNRYQNNYGQNISENNSLQDNFIYENQQIYLPFSSNSYRRWDIQRGSRRINKNQKNIQAYENKLNKKKSLQKLKEQYSKFKYQLQSQKIDKKHNKKNSLVDRQISPKQFSHIFVK